MKLRCLWWCKWWWACCGVWGLSLLGSPSVVAAPAPLSAADQSQIQTQVQSFYQWVLQHGPALQQTAPTVVERAHGRLDLDVRPLDAYVNTMMQSHLFSPTMAQHVRQYYLRHQQRLRHLPARTLAQIQRDGRGPMLETEDMDAFFCAQEYEYTPAFVRQMQVTGLHALAGQPRRAEAQVVSALHWKTPFRFVQLDGRWLIDGVCVYR